jgi:hypothetical protein
MCNCRGNEVSPAKRLCPVSKGKSSRRRTEAPIRDSGAAVTPAPSYRLRQRARTIFEDTDRAEAALQGMVPYERFLLRVQPITLLQSFDGANAAALPRTGSLSTSTPRMRRRRLARSRYEFRSARNRHGSRRRTTPRLGDHGIVLAVDCKSNGATFAHWAPSSARCTRGTYDRIRARHARRIQPGPGPGVPYDASGAGVARSRVPHHHPPRRTRVYRRSFDQAGRRDPGSCSLCPVTAPYGRQSVRSLKSLRLPDAQLRFRHSQLRQCQGA